LSGPFASVSLRPDTRPLSTAKIDGLSQAADSFCNLQELRHRWLRKNQIHSNLWQPSKRTQHEKREHSMLRIKILGWSYSGVPVSRGFQLEPVARINVNNNVISLIFFPREKTHVFFSPVDFFPRIFGVADLSPPFWKWQIWDLSSLVDFDLLQKETKHLN